jgi:hypothetical protein
VRGPDFVAHPLHIHTTAISTIYLSIYLSLYSPCGPWPLFQFLNLYTVGRNPWTGSSLSQGRYLHTEQTHIDNPCLEWDSKQRSQCSRERRPFMSLWSAITALCIQYICALARVICNQMQNTRFVIRLYWQKPFPVKLFLPCGIRKWFPPLSNYQYLHFNY